LAFGVIDSTLPDEVIEVIVPSSMNNESVLVFMHSEKYIIPLTHEFRLLVLEDHFEKLSTKRLLEHAAEAL
jgi:hypothetical protein